MSDLRGVAFFEWHGDHGFLDACNTETDPLTCRISERQMKVFLTLLARTERAIVEPQTSDRLGSWMAGYLAGWTSPLLEVNPGLTGRQAENSEAKTSPLSPLEDSAGVCSYLRSDPNSQFPSGSSSVLADGESGDSVAADPRNDATPDTSEKGVRDDV